MAYPFKLTLNQTAYLAPADIAFRFVNVTEDSRCPSDVQCIWAGQVTTLIEYTRASTGERLGDLSLTLIGGTSNDLSTKVIQGHTITLANVEPYPVSTKTIHSSDYVATLVVLNADANISDSIITSSPVALDALGKSIEGLEVGKQANITVAIHNGFDEDKPFVAIVEARSHDGVTRFLSWDNHTIAGKAWLDAGLSWTPEQAGDYQLRTFLIDNFQAPQVLTPVMTSSIEVHGDGMGDDGTDNDNADVIAENNQFALDFYSKLVEDGEEGNIFYSPWSISTAFALVYEGAREKTAEEIQSVFGFPPDENVRTSSFSSIQKDLNNNNSRGNYTLNTANALWVKEGYELSDDYVNVAKEAYDSEVSNVDFTRDESRVHINEWVESKTNEKIKDLIPEGVLDDLTRLVITNAIYFKGTWVTQFDEKNTAEEDFMTDSGNTVKVPMMKLEEAYFKYAETDLLQVIELPYQGDKVSMLILLPKDSTELSPVEESLTLDNLTLWKNSLRNQTVNVQIPKFKVETEYTLNELLIDLGMPSAFDPNSANLSAITDQEDLYISAALHKAFVEVNEEGTEAAAATGIVIGTTSVQVNPLFRADHPFVFIIQDSETGNILFMGRVSNPSS